MANLITAQEVIELAFAENSNMREESINNTSIRIAEIKYIKPVFGNMYSMLGTTYEDFTNEYIKPALAYFVKCEIVSSIAIDMSNSGIAVANPQYQSAASDKQRQRLYDSEMGKAKVLLDEALAYISAHVEEFPDFVGTAPKKHYRNGGILLGGGVSTRPTAIIGDAVSRKDFDNLSKEVELLREGIKGISVEQLIPITHSNIKALRDSGLLTAGTYYRITDYECTTKQAETRSANHPFDIIVQALDERTLSENAQAVAREGDNYFANCNLGAWQLKYTIDNDTTRYSWAKAEVQEQPQKWECSWGLLDFSYDNSSSTDYQEVDIDGKTWYLYRPLEPTIHLEGVSLYRKEYVGEPITSLDDLIFVSDEAPTHYEDEYEDYWEWPYEIRVTTKDGDVVATLYNDSDSVYYDSNDSDLGYYMDFTTDFEYDEDLGAYRFSTPNGAEDWWDNFIGGSFDIVNYIPYDGNYSDLSYAFESPLGKTTTYAYNVSDGTYIYSTENEDDYEQAIDTVRYIAYVPHEDGGKGVIYQMIDEHNNDCPYDFKNLQFLHEKEWYYTFSFKGNDLSLTDYCADNYIYTNRMTKWDTTTTPVPNAIPMVIFNARPNASGKTIGITHNCLNVSVKKGYVCATRIENLWWQPRMGGDVGVVNNLYINLTGVFYGNTIHGAARSFVVGTADAPATVFYDNQIYLPTFIKGVFRCNASTFVNNVLNLTESSSGVDSDNKDSGFSITSGSITSCNIENVNYETKQPIDAITLGVETVIRDCTIKIYKSLTINYPEGTTSTTKPLRFLNIDARGWDATTISIPSTFPVNSPYELKVAKNSQGVVKMWCDADLAN